MEQNIAFGLKQEGMAEAARSRRACADMLELVKLDQFAERKPHQLSGGQRQRVALARSLAKRPKVLLLDEPLGALDKKLREETQFELMDLQQQLGLTFIVVTHDQEEAMTMADRIAIMDKGEIVQVGDAARNLRGPGSRASSPISSATVNMFEGKVASDGDRARIGRQTASLITTDNAGEAPSGDTVCLRDPAGEDQGLVEAAGTGEPTPWKARSTTWPISAT